MNRKSGTTMSRDPVQNCVGRYPSFGNRTDRQHVFFEQPSEERLDDRPMRLDRQRSQPRLFHAVNDSHDVALSDRVRQSRSENRCPPLRPAGSVTCRRRFSAPSPPVDPHSRLPSLLRLLPAEKPLVATHSSDRNAGRELDRLFGVVGGQEVGQAPSSLGVTSHIFSQIGPIGNLALAKRHP